MRGLNELEQQARCLRCRNAKDRRRQALIGAEEEEAGNWQYRTHRLEGEYKTFGDVVGAGVEKPAHLVGGKRDADHQRRGDAADQGRGIAALEVVADAEF